MSASGEVLNDHYYPLQKETSAFNIYFKKIFKLMDAGASPNKILVALFDHYLNSNHMGAMFTNRNMTQQALVENLKSKIPLNNNDSDFDLTPVIHLFNSGKVNVNPTDDLRYLFSAFFSVFHYQNHLLTDSRIKNLLIIRDINNIYFHTILKKNYDHCYSMMKDAIYKEDNAYCINVHLVKMAHATDQYDGLLKKCMSHLHTGKALYADKVWPHLEILLQPATTDQVENIVLPRIIELLSGGQLKDSDMTVLMEKLPILLTKLNNATIEAKLIPLLLTVFCQEEFTISIQKVLLVCIDRLDEEALRRTVLPWLFAQCFEMQKSAQYVDKVRIRYAADMLTAVISKFANKSESDDIAEKLIKIAPKDFYVTYAYSKLKLFNKLRAKNLYVNESLFQQYNQPVVQDIETFLHDIEQKSPSDSAKVWTTGLEYMTKEQAARYYAVISSEETMQNVSVFTSGLRNLAALPKEIYPQTLWANSFEYIWTNRNKRVEYMQILILYLNKFGLSDDYPRDVLLALAHEAVKNISKDDDYSLYERMEPTNLLNACVSHMSSQELVQYVFPLIDLDKLHSSCYLRKVHDALKVILLKSNDEKLHATLFAKLFLVSLKTFLFECNDLFDIMIDKFSPVVSIYLCRDLMKVDFKNTEHDMYAYVFAGFYEKNKEFLRNQPGFCTGEQYHKSSTEAKSDNQQSSGATCVMM